MAPGGCCNRHATGKPPYLARRASKRFAPPPRFAAARAASAPTDRRDRGERSSGVGRVPAPVHRRGGRIGASGAARHGWCSLHATGLQSPRCGTHSTPARGGAAALQPARGRLAAAGREAQARGCAGRSGRSAGDSAGAGARRASPCRTAPSAAAGPADRETCASDRTGRRPGATASRCDRSGTAVDRCGDRAAAEPGHDDLAHR
jgi:hypothetical protein